MANWREGSNKPNPRGSKPPKATPPPAAKAEAKKPGDWRGKKGATEPAPADSKRRTYLDDKKKSGPRNIGILNVLLLLLVTLVISFVTILGCQPTKVPMMHLAGIHYDDPLWQPNAYGQEDRDNFKRSMDNPLGNVELTLATQSAAGTNTSRAWSDLNHTEFKPAITNFLDITRAPGGPKPGGWIFYLSCHGVTNFDGVPYLVAKNSRVLVPQKADTDSLNLVPLEEVLRTIADHPVVTRYAKSYKLLVLDTGRMDSQWNAARPYNDFPSAVRNLMGSLPEDLRLTNTYVLLSNDDGQKAWDDPAGFSTNFGRFFAEGLMGAADGEIGETENDNVSLAELEAYLKRNVNQWAQDHRNSPQTPVLITPGGQSAPLSEVMLARVGDVHYEVKPRSDSADQPRQQTDIQQLRELWAAFTFLGDHGAARLCPVRFGLVEQDFLTAEKYALGGVAYQKRYSDQCRDRIAPAIDDIALYSARLNPKLRRKLLDSELRYFAEGSIKSKLENVSYGCLAAWSLNEGDAQEKIPSLSELRLIREKIEAEKSQPDLAAKDQTPEPVCPDYYAAASQLMASLEDQRNVTGENLTILLDYLGTASNVPTAAPGGVHAVEVEFLGMLRDFLGLLTQDYELDPGSDAMISLRNTLVRAIAVRNQMEVLHTVPDERMYAWIEADLRRADTIRRSAEDYLFAYRIPEANAEYDSLVGLLTKIERESATLKEAYLAHDAVRKSTPFLLEWIAHQPYPGEERQQMLSRATSLVRQSHQLTVALYPQPLEGETQPNYEQSAPPEDKLVADLTLGYRELVGQLNLKSQNILEGQTSRSRADCETLLEIHNLLRCGYVAKISPDMVTYDRNGLITKLQEMTEKGLTGSNPEPVPNSPLMVALSSFTVAPWQLLTAQANSEADSRIGELGEINLPHCQELLRVDGPGLKAGNQLAAQILAGGSVPAESLGNFPSKTAALAATSYSGIPVALRRMIDNNYDTPSLMEYRTRRKDRFGNLAQRTLDDFWGNNIPGTSPYFERLAQLYFGIANRESAAISSPVTAEAYQQLGVLRREYSKWCLFDNPDEHVSGSTDLIDHLLTIQIPAEIPVGQSTVELMADGKAVEVRDSAGTSARGHLFPTQPSGVYQPRREFRQQFAPAAIQQARRKAVRIRYRGHVVEETFKLTGVAPPDAVEYFVEVQPPPYLDPEVIVRGDVLGMGDVIFVIDCSGSMGALDPGQRGEGGTARTRMDVAKGVILDVLDSMAEQKSFRVLTMAYGNRVGWESSTSNNYRYKNGIAPPAGIVPGNDVEIVGHQELALLMDEDPQRGQNGVNVSRLKEEIRKLSFLGETPLYYSIVKALEKTHPTNPTQLIVITDGQNDQTASSSEAFRTDILKMERALAGRKNVQLQVVGFHLDTEVKSNVLNSTTRPNKPNSADEIAWSAKHKGRGNFFSVQAQGTLFDSIVSLLNTPEYFSVQESRDPQSPNLLDFDTWWKSSQPLPGRAPFMVRTHEMPTDDSIPIQLRGGEKVQLTYDTQLKKLMFDDAQRRVLAEREIALTDPINGEGVYLGQILNFPAPSDGVLELPVLLKNRNQSLFTVRPFHIWAEITPSVTGTFAGNDVLDTRFVSDLLLENETQFPEFNLRLDQWPRSAAYARVKLFVETAGPIEPIRTIALDSFKEGSSQPTEPLDTTVGKVRVEVLETTGEFKFQVRVSIEPGAEGITPHQVEITPKPRRIRRSYFLGADGGGKIQRIEHRFQYREKGEFNRDSPRLDLWSREALTQKSPVFSADVQIPK
ncbi:MAG: hypothetical protein WDZ51_11750 [Pirellulaceae bacterium]